MKANKANNREELSDYEGVPRLTHGRNVSYDIPDPKLPEISQWIIGNPNRINLGRIGLKYKGDFLSEADISSPRQELDVWNGVVTSEFVVDGQQVTVVTQGDLESDAVAFTVESDLVASGALEVLLDFPYPPIHTTKYKYEVFVGVYDFPANHTTILKESRENRHTAHIYHEMQETKYHVNLRWASDAPLALTREQPERSTAINAHRFTLENRRNSSSLSFTTHFSPEKRVPSAPSTIRKRSVKDWHNYWKKGGFVDLTESSNAAADELQRRIILSQYHVRVNSAAKGQSPQESGLMNNGWYGKAHFEMFIWHNAHWATWGRQSFFDNIFPEAYTKLLPSSLARAKSMGWEGARWPKMTEWITGRSSPGGINGLLLWQQVNELGVTDICELLTWKASPDGSRIIRLSS